MHRAFMTPENNFVVEEPLDWTTEDEIAAVRQMYNHKNIRALSNYRRMLPYRTFHGAGMHVDAVLVRLAMNSLIDALESELL